MNIDWKKHVGMCVDVLHEMDFDFNDDEEYKQLLLLFHILNDHLDDLYNFMKARYFIAESL